MTFSRFLLATACGLFGSAAVPLEKPHIHRPMSTYVAPLPEIVRADTVPVEQETIEEPSTVEYSAVDGTVDLMAMPDHPDDPAYDLFQTGRESLSGGDFNEAANIFAELVRKYPKSAYVPEAIYWRAYALFNIGEDNYQQVVKLVDGLLKDYPKASNRQRAVDLRNRALGALAANGDTAAALDIRRSTSKSPRTCEDQLTESTSALVALQNMDPEAAIAPLKTLFARRDKCSTLIRRQAVSMLAANGSDAMNELIVHIAATDPDAEVRGSAYAMMSAIPSSASIDVLGGVLKTAPDDAQKEGALQALAANRNLKARQIIRDFVVDGDQPEEFRVRAIQALASPQYAQPYFGGTPSIEEMARVTDLLKENGAFLREVYPKLKGEGLKKTLLNGLIALGGADNRKLVFDVVATKGEPLEMRRELLGTAISGIGDPAADNQPRPFASPDDLIPLFDRLDDRLMREVLVGVFATHSTNATSFDKLASIARKDRDKTVRQAAINALAESKNPKAAAVLSEIVNQQQP